MLVLSYKLKGFIFFHFFKIINLINIPILLFVFFFVLHPHLSNYICIKKSTWVNLYLSTYLIIIFFLAKTSSVYPNKPTNEKGKKK